MHSRRRWTRRRVATCSGTWPHKPPDGRRWFGVTVEPPMAGPHLIYFVDPMCSWCWGFAPVIEAIRQRFGDALPIRLIVGGLRPGTTKPLDEAGKRTSHETWEPAHQATGQ